MHQQVGLGVTEKMQTVAVHWGIDKHFVDAARLCLDVDRAKVLDGKGVLTLKCGIQVGDHPHDPVPAITDRLEGRRRTFFMARTKRAWPPIVIFYLMHAGCEIVRSLSPRLDNGDPTSRQLVEAHLTHGVRIGGRCSHGGRCAR